MVDTIMLWACCLGSGYLLSGSWKGAVAAVMIQMIVASNLTAVLKQMAKIAQYQKSK